MTHRINYDGAEGDRLFADISDDLYNKAVSRAMSDDMTLQEALKDVITEDIVSVE